MNIITALRAKEIVGQFRNINIFSFEDMHDVHEAFRTLPKLYPNCIIEILDVMNISRDEWKLKSAELLHKSSYDRPAFILVPFREDMEQTFLRVGLESHFVMSVRKAEHHYRYSPLGTTDGIESSSQEILIWKNGYNGNTGKFSVISRYNYTPELSSFVIPKPVGYEIVKISDNRPEYFMRVSNNKKKNKFVLASDTEEVIQLLVFVLPASIIAFCIFVLGLSWIGLFQ